VLIVVTIYMKSVNSNVSPNLISFNHVIIFFATIWVVLAFSETN
jgi:hypothetical protein